MRCCCCGSGGVISNFSKTDYFKYKGNLLPIIYTGDYCPHCGEMLLTIESQIDADKKIKDFKKKVDNCEIGHNR